MAKPFVFFIFFFKIHRAWTWSKAILVSTVYKITVKMIKMNQSNKFTFCLNYFGKKRNNLFHMFIFFVRTDPRNAQSQCEGNTKIFLSCYFFVSAVLDFQLLVHMLISSLNTSKKMKDIFTFWTFSVGYNTLNLQSIFITNSFLTQMTYCWSKGEYLQHFMELTKIYFQYLISNTAIAEIIEVWVIYFEYGEET